MALLIPYNILHMNIKEYGLTYTNGLSSGLSAYKNPPRSMGVGSMARLDRKQIALMQGMSEKLSAGEVKEERAKKKYRKKEDN